ncbi:sine oculis-binding protein homolog A-like [Lytechinus pictus]|uniref:sine oculis-binding protein homolog A-like n=1 Tax=Lytechinus pictus TaxID=7653 RepID=UPI0030BA06A3
MDEKADHDSDGSAIKIQVKTEPPDEDIQDYAEDTMNELLAIYGYNEKVEHGVTQNMQLAPKYPKEERGLRKRLLMAHSSKGDAASECSVSGNVTPVSGSDPQSAEEEPVSPSSSQDNTELLEALQDGKCSNRDHITCAWCKSPGFKHYTLNTQTESKAFCSERCFASCRRAYFKRNKVCDWCRHTRHQDYIYLIDGERRLQFCSSKCMNQYKMDSYYKDGPSVRRKVAKAATSSGSKSNGSVPVSPTLQQQSLSERNSPDTVSQDAAFHDSQPSPSNIPLSGVFQTNSSSSQSMMGMPQLRPSGVFGVQTVVPPAMSFRQVVPKMPVVQVVGSGGVPLNLVQGLNQSSASGSRKVTGRLNPQQWSNLQGVQGVSSFKKIRPKPQSNSATLPSSTVTSSASNNAPFTNQKPRKDTQSSTSTPRGNSVLPPVTVMVPHPVFIPIPVPIPIPIPVCREAYEAAMAKIKENTADTEQEATTSYDHDEQQERKSKKRISDMFTNGSSHLPSSSSTGAFVPYRSHQADLRDNVSNSTDGHSMEAMLSSSMQTSLTIPSSSSASEALESRLRLQPQRHPSHISTATVEAMHRSINSRMLRHKCLQRSASMDLSFGRYNTLSALTDFLGEKRGFNPHLHGSPGNRELTADSHGLSTRASHSALPTKGAGELSPSVREALRCHLTRRLSQSALNLTDVGRYPEEDQLRRSQSMSRLQEDSDSGHHHEMEAISSHTSLEKLADTSDSSEHIDPQICADGGGSLQMDDSGLQPAIKRRCLGSQNQID